MPVKALTQIDALIDKALDVKDALDEHDKWDNYGALVDVRDLAPMLSDLRDKFEKLETAFHEYDTFRPLSAVDAIWSTVKLNAVIKAARAVLES